MAAVTPPAGPPAPRAPTDPAPAPAPALTPVTPPAPAPAPATAAVRVTDRCQGCGACLLTCPTHAIRPQGGQLFVLADLCTGCIECVDVCPVDAVEETR